jgi:hypothetical protein
LAPPGLVQLNQGAGQHNKQTFRPNRTVFRKIDLSSEQAKKQPLTIKGTKRASRNSEAISSLLLY